MIFNFSFAFLANCVIVYSIYNKLKRFPHFYNIIYYSKNENLLNKLLSIILYMVIVIDHHNINIVKIIPFFVMSIKYSMMF